MTKKIGPILDWSVLDTLRLGTNIQQLAHSAILSLGLKQILQSSGPQLVGDIALGIEPTERVLTILISSYDFLGTEKLAIEKFWACSSFRTERQPINGMTSLLISFNYNQFSIKLIAQNIPAVTQNAYLTFRAKAKRLNETDHSEFEEELVNPSLDRKSVV